MPEGVRNTMMNQKRTRVLISLVLAAAIGLAFGTEAHAALMGSRPAWGATVASNAPKPVPGPLSGEPDSGAGGAQPPKTGTYPTGGFASPWALRIHWLFRTWLGTVAKRLP